MKARKIILLMFLFVAACAPSAKEQPTFTASRHSDIYNPGLYGNTGSYSYTHSHSDF
jgi:hypothetical protein